MKPEVGVLASSCGKHEPRGLKRFYARTVTKNGKSVPLDIPYPPVEPQPVELNSIF
jgi:hypothetical protein